MTTIQEKADMKTDRNGFVRCRVCGCTEIEACDPPCGWEPGEADLCTGCAEMMRALLRWSVGAHRATKASLMRELERAKSRIKRGQSPYNARKKQHGAVI